MPQIEQVESLSATLLERREQRLQRRLALLHQVQHRAPRRARAEPRQPRERLGQRFDLLRCHDPRTEL